VTGLAGMRGKDGPVIKPEATVVRAMVALPLTAAAGHAGAIARGSSCAGERLLPGVGDHHDAGRRPGSRDRAWGLSGCGREGKRAYEAPRCLSERSAWVGRRRAQGSVG
jgi:hypothetical protein